MESDEDKANEEEAPIADEQKLDTLERKKHVEALTKGLTSPLSHYFEKIVPAQTWTVYWITHSLTLLEQHQFLQTVTKDVIEFLRECAHQDGGYGGGPGQIAHLATSFAAVNALITTSSDEALDSIDRVNLVKFLHRMKQSDGSFTMHDGGEIDSRASYCALAILRCLNIHDYILLNNVSDWLLSCQTYEGGFGSVPGSEAHGGYTFCCVASLCLLNQLHRANLPALLRWLSNKQLLDKGGFCGRSNKLVDSCYSYWQGAVFPLIHPFLKDLNLNESWRENNHTGNVEYEHNNKFQDATKTTNDKDNSIDNSNNRTNRPRTRSSTRESRTDDKNIVDDSKMKTNDLEGLVEGKILNNWLFDAESLQDYVLNSCQSKFGLFRDKPGVEPDFYHTCYSLSGLSLSQHQPDDKLIDIGSQPINVLAPTHPLFNLDLECLDHCFDYFKNLKFEVFQDDSSKV